MKYEECSFTFLTFEFHDSLLDIRYSHGEIDWLVPS